MTQRDSTTTYGLRAEYHVSRELVLKASASRQLYDSNAAEFELRRRRLHARPQAAALKRAAYRSSFFSSARSCGPRSSRISAKAMLALRKPSLEPQS